MSDIREVHNAVRTDLERRRELAAMTKPELITLIMSRESTLADVHTRLSSALDRARLHAQGRARWRER